MVQLYQQLLYDLKPTFVDYKIILSNYVNKIEEITKKTKALLVPNLIGNLPDWKKIRQIANKYKLLIIEDQIYSSATTKNLVAFIAIYQ